MRLLPRAVLIRNSTAAIAQEAGRAFQHTHALFDAIGEELNLPIRKEDIAVEEPERPGEKTYTVAQVAVVIAAGAFLLFTSFLSLHMLTFAALGQSGSLILFSSSEGLWVIKATLSCFR
jgi:hypothetical protein